MQPIVHHVFAAGLILRLICSIGLERSRPR